MVSSEFLIVNKHKWSVFYAAMCQHIQRSEEAYHNHKLFGDMRSRL